MKKIKTIALASVVAMMFSSCAVVKTPLTGFVYTDMKSPFAVTSNANSSKVGTAKA